MFIKNVYIIIWDFADSDEGEEIAKMKFNYLDSNTLDDIVYTLTEESEALYGDAI